MFQHSVQDAKFAAVLREMTAHMQVRSYSLMGVRADADLLLWCVGRSPEEHQELATMLNHARLASYLETPFSYLAMTHRASTPVTLLD